MFLFNASLYIKNFSSDLIIKTTKITLKLLYQCSKSKHKCLGLQTDGQDGNGLHVEKMRLIFSSL